MGGRAAREGFPSAASQSVAADGALLELREAVVRFGGVRALDGVSVSVDKGEMLGLVGPNGSGKTTLLNAITGVYSLAAGQIIWMGRPVRISRPWQALELGISRTFQGVELVPQLTVLENVLLARHKRLPATWLEACVWVGRAAKTERREAMAAMEVLERLGIAECAHVRAGSLPLGTQKVVAIARALAASPRLLLLDEPTAGLSWPDKERLVATMLGICASAQMTVIWVEHDLQVIKEACTRVVVLHEGKKLADGPPSHVFSHPRVLEVYSGFSARRHEGFSE